MLFLYRIYQIFVAIPLLLLITILAALATIIGSMLGFSRTMGYWPGRIWAKLFCMLTLVRVKVKGRDNIDRNT